LLGGQGQIAGISKTAVRFVDDAGILEKSVPSVAGLSDLVQILQEARAFAISIEMREIVNQKA
jgi:hypothetical protein